MLLDRAELASLYGDQVSAKTWREVAAIASRVLRPKP
jgi:hypothetical protein